MELTKISLLGVEWKYDLNLDRALAIGKGQAKLFTETEKQQVRAAIQDCAQALSGEVLCSLLESSYSIKSGTVRNDGDNCLFSPNSKGDVFLVLDSISNTEKLGKCFIYFCLQSTKGITMRVKMSGKSPCGKEESYIKYLRLEEGYNICCVLISESTLIVREVFIHFHEVASSVAIYDLEVLSFA